jgi:hypothetical protein
MMRRLLCVALACCLGEFARADVIFDNGGADGSTGLSVGDFDFAYREATDDFVLGPEWPLYNVTGAHFSYVWYSGDGLDNVSHVEVMFYRDDGTGQPLVTPMPESPGIVPISNQYYSGDYYFARAEIVYEADFSAVTLPSNTRLWFSATLQECPENAFWLTSAYGSNVIWGYEAYVSMPDCGYPKWTSSSYAFGDPVDVNFRLAGYGVPEPGTLTLLAVAALALVRRPRSFRLDECLLRNRPVVGAPCANAV